MHITDDDIRFVTALECFYLKQQSRVLTAREFPC